MRLKKIFIIAWSWQDSNIGPSVLETYDEPTHSAKGTLIRRGIICLVLVRDILIFVDLKKNISALVTGVWTSNRNCLISESALPLMELLLGVVAPCKVCVVIRFYHTSIRLLSFGTPFRHVFSISVALSLSMMQGQMVQHGLMGQKPRAPTLFCADFQNIWA